MADLNNINSPPHMKQKTLPWSAPTLIASACVLACLAAQAQAPLLYSDDFEADTSANWTLLDAAGNGVSDYTVQFRFDYSQQNYSLNGVTNRIPLAPNSAPGATRGVKLTVNKNDDVAAIAAVNLFPLNQTFSGNYALRADMWINYNGGRYGGSGSTEFGMFGINHSGTVTNWVVADPNTAEGDGSWFATAGEGGAAVDFRSYEFDGFSTIRLVGVEAGIIGADNFEQVFQDRFPLGEYETDGAVGKKWVQVEVAQRNGNLIWKLNGFVIAERPISAPVTSGNIMIGTFDSYTSIANPKADNFVIFDNVRVVNLDAETAPATVRVEATDAEASEPGANTGTFTITREGGDQSQPLVVPYRLSGSAQPGLDYSTNNLPGVAVIPANASSVDLVVTPLDDFKGEPTETIVVTLTGNPAYEMRDPISASIDLLDDGDVTAVQIAAADAFSYERMVEDTGAFSIYRLGDTAGDLTVNLGIAGTASNGVDYEVLPNSVVIPAGSTNVLLTVTPRDDALVEGDETVVVSLRPGPNYQVGAVSEATVTILDNDHAPAPVLYADNFDTDTSANWQLRFGAGNSISDYLANFAYDYSADSIPSAPHSAGATTLGLKLTVNKNDGTASAAGLNLYARNQNFSGDYAVKFDMYLTFNASAAGTTEHAIFGLNHSGAFTNRHGAAGSDGVWFGIETDGSASRGGTYLSYLGAAGAPTFQTKAPGPFAPYFTRPPYLAAGAVSGQWVDVEESQVGGVVTLKINGVEIFRRTDTTAFSAGTIMLGYMDSYNSIGSPDNYVIYDNLRVLNLTQGPPPSPTITGVRIAGANVEVDFTSPSGLPAQFTLETATAVTGTWQAASGAVITSPAAGQFRATAPYTADPARFFRIRR